MHYCYILKAREFCKIGHTKNLQKRINTLQTGCPFTIKVACLFTYNTQEAAKEMEGYLHKQLNNLHVRGEWFKYRLVKKILQKQGKNIPKQPDTIHKIMAEKKAEKQRDLEGCTNEFPHWEETARQHLHGIMRDGKWA